MFLIFLYFPISDDQLHNFLTNPLRVPNLPYVNTQEVNPHFEKSQDQRPTCRICLKTFSSKGNLKSHMNIHTGDRPYKCNVCGQDFTHHTVYRRHQKNYNH
ncbi:unnamed protein product [Owenia fusiformis]|uniref:Uncharacterized protein n=1 Tax=Owenia fusiformis TaxID=6347 RepID=A0A8J1TEP2_OWEFU|nr:unnamed protein product [Owenia fusiformis]